MAFALRNPLTLGPEAASVSNQLVMVAGAMLIAISIGFLAVIEQLKKARVGAD